MICSSDTSGAWKGNVGLLENELRRDAMGEFKRDEPGIVVGVDLELDFDFCAVDMPHASSRRRCSTIPIKGRTDFTVPICEGRVTCID